MCGGADRWFWFCMGLWKGLKAACSNPKPKGLSAKGSNFSQPSAEEESTSYPTNPVYQVPQTDSYNRQPAGVKVDFDTNGLEHAKYHTQQEPEPDSPVQSLAQQVWLHWSFLSQDSVCTMSWKAVKYWLHQMLCFGSKYNAGCRNCCVLLNFPQ